MSSISKFFSKLLLKLAFPLLLFLGGMYVWNYTQHKQKSKIATVYFQNVDGLSRGAPVYVGGVIVGKVKDIYPIINDNKVAVDILITKKDFPTPKQGTKAATYTSLSRGGAQVIELKDIQATGKGRSVEPITSDYLSRMIMEMYQITKDFSYALMRMVNDPATHAYRDRIQSQLNNLKARVKEDGVKGSIQDEINKLNETVKEIESGERQALSEKDKQSILDTIEATKKTLGTLGTVTDSYRDEIPEEKADTQPGYQSQSLDI